MNYRDKLILDAEVGTSDHDEMQMALDQKTVATLLHKLFPDISSVYNEEVYLSGYENSEYKLSEYFKEKGLPEEPVASKILIVLRPDGKVEHRYYTDWLNCDENKKNVTRFKEKYAETLVRYAEDTQVKIWNGIFSELDISFEVPVKNGGFLIGVADCVVSKKLKNYYGKPPPLVLIEIKTNLTNFGEIQRQLQVYKSYFSAIKYVILYKTCKDPRIIKSLEAQGFPCIKFEDIAEEVSKV